MAEEMWQLSEGEGQTAFSELVAGFKSRATSLIRDAGVSVDQMPSEMGKVVRDYVRHHKLGPAETARVHQACSHGTREAALYHKECNGRYPGAQKAEPEPWSPRLQAELDAERAAFRGGETPASQPLQGRRRFEVSKKQMHDPKWMRENQEELNQARKDGTLDMVGE
jgi:hypothetical protein